MKTKFITLTILCAAALAHAQTIIVAPIVDAPTVTKAQFIAAAANTVSANYVAGVQAVATSLQASIAAITTNPNFTAPDFWLAQGGNGTTFLIKLSVALKFLDDNKVTIPAEWLKLGTNLVAHADGTVTVNP